MKLIIPGNIPSQKNNKVISINRKTNKRFIRSNDKVLEWQEFAISQLKTQFRGYKITNFPISITLIFYWSNNYRHDLDNGAAGILDALVHAGILQDDNINFINKVTLIYGGYDKNNPRCEIILED